MPADSTVQELDELARKAKGARGRFEPTWFLNLAYYQGNQWLYWARGRLYEPRLDPWRVTFTDNRLIGVVRTEVAKMTKQRPIFVATPTTGDDADVSAAQLSERMLQYIWTEHDLQRKQRAALMWSRIVGAGFWKIYWDSTSGSKVEVLLDPQGQVVMDQSGRPMDPNIVTQLPPEVAAQLNVKTIAQGDVCVEVKSALEILVDPLAGEEGLSSAEWLVEESVRSKDYVQRRYNVDLPEDAQAVAGVAEARMGGVGGEGVSGTSYKGVAVKEYWARPSSKHPNGRYAVWAANKLLKEDNNPYDDMPYVMFQGIPVPGRFWPTSTVEQLRGVQTELNKTRSQIRENAARIGNPALLKSRMSRVEYTGLPGEVVEFDDVTQNSLPSFLQPPSMPPYVLEEIDRLNQSIQEISGQHEVSAGQVPPGVTAASAINLLQEQDDTRLGPDISEMENTLGEAGRKILKLVAQFYSDERTIRIGGDDGYWDIFSFRGAQLKDATHVSVQAGSAIPLSKAAKQANMEHILTLFIQNGVPLSQRQLARFLKDMDVGGYERLVEQYSEDETQINGENRRMALGQALPINTYDNDEAHIDGHESFQKSARYQQLDPKIMQLVEMHVQAHRDRQQAQQQQAQQQQIAAEQQAAVDPTDMPIAQLQQQHEDYRAQLQAQTQLQTAQQRARQQPANGRPS